MLLPLIRQIHLVKILIPFALIFYLGSCRTGAFVNDKISQKEVNEVGMFEVKSRIVLIEKSNTGFANDSVAELSKKLLKKVVTENYAESLKIKQHIMIEDSVLNKQLYAEIISMVNSCRSNASSAKLKQLKLSNGLDSVLEANGKRFGMVFFCTGFVRTNENYEKELKQGVITGVATLGMYIPTPVKSTSIIDAIILDSKENNIAYYKQSVFREYNPIEEKVLAEQIKYLFNGFLLPKID